MENNKVFLTRYDEYPIYDSAEGGFYYAGRDYSEYYECNSIDEAKELLKQMSEDLVEHGFVVDEDAAYLRSRYIGEGAMWVIEYKLGEHASGRQVYC